MRNSNLRWFFILLLLGFSASLQAETIKFRQVAIYLQDEMVRLDAQHAIPLNETISEALLNGVPLTFVTRVQLRRKGAWIWESDVVESELYSVLRYHPLSSLYEVHRLEDDSRQRFATIEAALSSLGEIIGFTIIPRADLDTGTTYEVSLTTALDIGSLPLPLRPQAYISEQWRLKSKVGKWQLNP